MTGSFDDATAVLDRGDGSTFDVRISELWTIGPGRPNGGYLLATLGRAALAAGTAAGGDHPHPVAASVQYVSPPAVGDAVVETEVLRVGRSASQVRARLLQEGRPRVDAAFVLGRLDAGSVPHWGGEAPPDMPPESECEPMGALGEGPSMRLAIRHSFDPATAGWMRGAPAGAGELRSWFRFADDRPVDPLALLFVVDALPPATFDVVTTGWVPTLGLTAYVRAVPAPGPLLLRFRAGMIQDGLVDEVMDVWDSAGRLVAQSTQLAGIRVPAG